MDHGAMLIRRSPHFKLDDQPSLKISYSLISHGYYGLLQPGRLANDLRPKIFCGAYSEHTIPPLSNDA